MGYLLGGATKITVKLRRFESFVKRSRLGASSPM